MRILFLSPTLPLPADTGGKIRIWHILKGLAKGHEVHFLALCDPMPDSAIQKQLDSVIASAQLIPQSPRSRQIGGLLAMLRGMPYHVGAQQSTAMSKAIRQFSAQLQPDIVFVNTIWMAPYLTQIPDARAVIDQQNADRQWWESYSQSTRNPLKRRLVQFNGALVRRFEHRKYPKFKLCFSVCEEDRVITQPLMATSGRVVVAPNGVDTRFFEPMSIDIVQNTIAFVGSMDVAANIAAVHYFVEHVLPIIWQTKPELRFIAIGRRPHHSVRHLAKNQLIEVTGTVDDVRPHLAQAQVVVLPHTGAGGTKLKVLTSMAMEKAIVATPASVRGLNVEPNRDLLVAKTPSDFAEQVVRLIEDPNLCIQLGKRARQTVEAQYSWDSIMTRMLDDLNSIM